MRINISTLALGAVLLGLAGCGDKTSTNSEPKPSLADATSQKSAAAISKEVALAALPKADKATKAENYVELNSGDQLMFSYLALAAMPIDYKEIAAIYSGDYYRARDEFKKNDLLTALKPKIDAEIAKAALQRYVKLTTSGRSIEKYEFEKKAFPLNGPVSKGTSYQYFNDNNSYSIGFTNTDTYRYLTVASESDARKIEEMRSKYEDMNLDIYAFIQEADISKKQLKAEIVKVILTDKKGLPLASQ